MSSLRWYVITIQSVVIMITSCGVLCCKATLMMLASNDDTLRSIRAIRWEQQRKCKAPWEWIDACPTQEDARRLDKTLRCGGGYWVALLRVCNDWLSIMIYHVRFNDCVKWSLEIEREGRTQEYVSDKLHKHGASVCGVTRSMLMHVDV